MAVAYDNIIYNSVMDEIERVLLDVRDEIRAKMESEGVNASGRTSAGMQVQRYESGVRLVLTGEDVAPLATLEVGRAGGNVPGGFRMTKAGVLDVSNTFKAILVEWAKAKGIADFGWGKATIVGRRIAAEGTERHKSPIDVYSEEVERGLSRIRQNIKVEVTKYIHNSLTYR